jgi:hypothetical protein
MTVRTNYYVENVLFPWIEQQRQQCMPTWPWQADDVLPERRRALPSLRMGQRQAEAGIAWQHARRCCTLSV